MSDSANQSPTTAPGTRSNSKATFLLLFVPVLVLFPYLEASLLTETGATQLPNLGFLISVPLLIVSVALILPWRIRWIFLGLATAGLAALCLMDTAYYRFFGTLPSTMSQIPIAQAWAVKDSARGLLSITEFSPLLLGLVFLLLGLFGKGDVFRFKVAGGLKKLAVVGIALSGLAYFIALITPVVEVTHHRDRDDLIRPINHWASRYSNLSFAQTFGLWSFHARDVYRSWNNRIVDQSITDEESQLLGATLKDVNRINSVTSPLYGVAKDYNVVIIQIEALQSFALNTTVEGVEVTPFLNKLASQSMYWNNVYDSTYIGRTSDAEFMVHTGLYPDRDKATAFSHTNKDVLAFPALLKERGYKTASYHGYRRDFWNRTNTHPWYGIDKLIFEEDLEVSEKLGLGVPDREMLEQFEAQLGQSDGLTYSFVVTLSSHHPFLEVPSSVKEMFPQTVAENATVGGFLQLAHYVDNALEGFFAGLAARGLDKNTLFVIYGDHDVGGLGIKEPEVSALAKTRVSELVGVNPWSIQEDRVPLIIHTPSLDATVVDAQRAFAQTPATLMDVFPTIFHMLGLDIPNGIVGTHLFHNEDRWVALPYITDEHGLYARRMSKDYLYALPIKLPGVDRVVPLKAYSLQFDRADVQLPLEFVNTAIIEGDIANRASNLMLFKNIQTPVRNGELSVH